MIRNSFRAAAAVAVLAFAGAAQANEWLPTSQAYVEGSGENASVAYAGERPAGVALPGAVVTGSGANVSVALTGAPNPSTRNFIAVIEGSGENQTVRHIPLPRG